METLKTVLMLLVGGSGSSWLNAAGRLLFLVGLWRVFQKCGLPGWHALVPCFRELQLGRCASRETEGRVLCCGDAVFMVIRIVNLTPNPEDWFFSLQQGVILVAGFVMLVYSVRVWIGLCYAFGMKKRWAVCGLFLEFIPALIWGFSDRYQPLWKVPDKSAAAAEFFSGSQADVLEEGLTVNLEERSVRDFFRKKYLLRDIHMTIQPGHMVLLLGGSGAGKTTFVNAVNGYEKAKAEVVLNGTNVYAEYAKMQYEIGFVPQADLIRANDTVQNTLLDTAMLRLPQDFSASGRKERVETVMEIFGLLPVRNSLVGKLSGGQRKRLSIAMEFISNPALFILDEPDSGLDGVMARELMQQLRRIADQGKIVIVITHTPDRVIDLFDDVIVLAKDNNRTGRLAYFGSVPGAREFFGRERMEEIVKCINREEEGGEGRADEFIRKYAALAQEEAQHV